MVRARRGLDRIDALDSDGLRHVAHFVVGEFIERTTDMRHSLAQRRIGGVAHGRDGDRCGGRGVTLVLVMVVLGDCRQRRAQRDREQQEGEVSGSHRVNSSGFRSSGQALDARTWFADCL